MNHLFAGGSPSFALDSSTLSQKTQPKIYEPETAKCLTCGKVTSDWWYYDGRGGCQCRACLPHHSILSREKPGEAGQACLSTCHISPFSETPGGAGPKTRQWVKKSVPCWDYGKHPETEKKFFFRSETEVNVPVELAPGVEEEEVEPSMLIALDGGLAKVIKGRVKSRVERETPTRSRRGAISTYSAGARRRLLRLLAKTDQRNRPVFCTLTYPDVYPESPETVKRHLDNFGKRLLRKYPQACFIWRVEAVERKSGDNIGNVAPHFHLLVWGVPCDELAGWLPAAWNSVIFRNVDKWGGAMQNVEAEKKKHFNVHSQPDKAVQALKSFKGVMFYASKYIGKVVESEPAGEGGGDIPDVWQWTGKHWGIVGRENLPLSVVLVVNIAQSEAIRATRLARKMIKLVGRDLAYGLTWFINGGEAQRYLTWLLGGEAAIHLTTEFSRKRILKTSLKVKSASF